MYKLVIADDEGSTSTVPVIRDEITIGRKQGNTIRLTERNVSRRHARVVRSDGQVYVEDIEARYGIKKNGAKIDGRAQFSPGDIVAIGDYQLTLEAKKSANDPPDHIPAATPPKKPTGRPSKAAKAPPAKSPSGKPPGKPPATNAHQDQATSNETDDRQGQGTQIMPAMAAKLVVVSSNFAGQEFPLKSREMVVGRGDDCDIIIDHRSVSKKHAKIVRKSNAEYKIVDLNSKNGITIGGEEYRAVHIKRGDIIELGHVKFRFVDPGENYVFTPQPDSGDFGADTESTSTSGAMIAAVLVVAVLIGAAILLFTRDSTTTDAAPADNSSVAAARASDSPSEPPDSAPEPPSKVSQAIAESRENIAAGHLDRAMGTLESAKKYLDPSPAQNDTIAKLVGSAKNEKPFKKHYVAAQDDLDETQFEAALQRLSNIPEHSVFFELYHDKKLRSQALAGLVDQGRQALSDDQPDQARTSAQKALQYAPENAQAAALIDKIDARKARVASARADRRQPRANRPRAKSRTRPKSKPRTSSADDGVSAKEANQLFESAKTKVLGSNPGSAISDCKKAISAGDLRCYRILALAHKRMGDSGAACSNLQHYLDTQPSNADGVQQRMDRWGCQ